MASEKSTPKALNSKKLRRRGSANKGSYDSYIRRVLIGVHPTGGISKNALGVMNSCMEGLERRLATQAGALARHSNTQTMRTKDLEAAVRILFPSGLCSHAIAEGKKAVDRSKEN